MHEAWYLMRRLALLSIALLVAASCGGKPETSTRTPASLADVNEADLAFEALARAQVDAWNSRDRQAVKVLFAEDAVAEDATFGDYAVGTDHIAGLVAMVSGFGPSWQARLKDRYIGLQDGLALDELWNLRFGMSEFTQDDPIVEVDWLRTRDSRISHWTLFYGLDFMEKVGATTPLRPDQVKSLLSRYQMAWSSGSEREVANLYSSDAIRQDMVFQERLEGRKAIASWASSFFAWYPGAQWSLALAFGEGSGQSPTTGGLYGISVRDLRGEPCQVQAAVLLHTSQDLIVDEVLYYQAESLARCGWAR
jgi:ketosteroid isomerase-like protein